VSAGDRQPPLAPDEVPAARPIWEAAATDLVRSLSGQREGVFGEWSDETVDLVSAVLPLFVSACFDALSGDDEPMRRVLELVRAHGTTRARRGISLGTHLQIDVATRSRILMRLAEIAHPAVTPDLKWRVTEALVPFFDQLLISHMLAYGEEAAALLLEQEDTVAFALRMSEAAFAHGELGGRIVFANDRFADYFSRTTTVGPTGATWEDVLPEAGVEMLGDANQGRDAWRDVEVVDTFGTRRLVRLSLHPVKDRLQALAIDVGDRVAYERRHAEFVRGLIHDLRAPSTLISGWSRTLLDSADRLDTATQAKALETINKAAHQLSTLTDNLLELVVIESGGHGFSMDPVDVAALARSVRDVVGPDVEVDAPDPAVALTDEDAVSRILTNLVDNALTHGRPPLLVRVETQDGTVTIDVCDRGDVDEGIVAAAFRARVESSRGFGIGLRTAWLVADAIGAELELGATAPTTFTLRLPAAH